ncbi:MAG: hypothetical protein CMQ57_01300 [Gammaproteobacteria bacterium]|jgi:tetrahydromethanopterin S-methyltransferase subunit G|nr:hypothetical protein [Gammaproteobacteria bacterium]
MSDDRKLDNVVEQFLRHEVQCEERWKTTFNRLDDIDEKLDRMEQRQLQFGGALILFLLGLVVTLAFQV